jgi:NADH-quinone oxidoreductase subunit L
MDFPGLGWLSGFLSGHGGEAGLSGSLAAHTVEPSAGLEWAVGGLDAVLALAAALLAWRLYGPAGTRRSPARLDHPLGLALASGFGLDRLYTAAIGRPYARLAGPLWTRVDEGGVDEAVEATARGAGLAGAGLGAWATGRVSMYVLMLLAGLAGILVLLALTAGAS